MKHSHEHDRVHDQSTLPADIEQALIAWSVKLSSGQATPLDHERFHAWRRENPAHERAWQQLQTAEADILQMSDTAKEVALETLNIARQQRKRVRQRKKNLKVMVAALIFLTGSAAMFNSYGPSSLQADYEVPVGQRMQLTLSDGTRLLLNTNTRIAVHYSMLKREVNLVAGELYIQTGSDQKSWLGHRPFWVTTVHTGMEALGTQFIVDQNPKRTRLHVVEKTVLIHHGTGLAVHAGESYDIYATDQTPVKTPDTHFDPTAWMDGVLVAKGMRLDNFASELSRYQAINIQMDSEVAAMTVSGVFQLNQQYPAVHALQAVARSLPVRISQLSATQFQIEKK